MATSSISMGAKTLTLLVAVASLTVLLSRPVQAGIEIIVGDGNGWKLGVNYTEWAANKTFTVGDTLVFKYTSGVHDVFRVNGTEFKNCSTQQNLGSYTTGEDKIMLNTTGNMWFICSKANSNGTHCSQGQKLKIAVLATEAQSPLPAAARPTTGRAPLISVSAVVYLLVPLVAVFLL